MLSGRPLERDGHADDFAEDAELLRQRLLVDALSESADEHGALESGHPKPKVGK